MRWVLLVVGVAYLAGVALHMARGVDLRLALIWPVSSARLAMAGQDPAADLRKLAAGP